MEPKLIWFLGAATIMTVMLLAAAVVDLIQGERTDMGARPSGALSHIALPGMLLMLLPAMTYQLGLSGVILSLIPLSIAAAMWMRRGNAGEQQAPLSPVVYWLGLIVALGLTAVCFALTGFLVSTITDQAISTQHSILGLSILSALLVLIGGLQLSRVAIVLQSIVMSWVIISLLFLIALVGGPLKGFRAVYDAVAALPAEIASDAGLNRWIGGLGSQGEVPDSVLTWPPVLLITMTLSAMGLAALPVLRGPRIRSRVSRSRIIALALNFTVILAVLSIALALLGLWQGTSTAFGQAQPRLVDLTLLGFLEEQGAVELTETRGGTLSLVPMLWNVWTDTYPWAVGILGASFGFTVLCGRLRTLVAYSSTLTQNFWISKLVLALATVAAGMSATAISISAVPVMLFSMLAIAVVTIPAFISPHSQRVDGLAAGLGVLVVFLTDPWLQASVNIRLIEGWPLSIHSGVWGCATVLLVRTVVRALTKAKVSQ